MDHRRNACNWSATYPGGRDSLYVLPPAASLSIPAEGETPTRDET
jgi:hypothetical protein